MSTIGKKLFIDIYTFKIEVPLGCDRCCLNVGPVGHHEFLCSKCKNSQGKVKKEHFYAKLFANIYFTLEDNKH